MAATILIVEDEISVARAVRSVLLLDQHDVLLAFSGTEALEVMRQRTPDLIISDVMMPSMSGYQFYEAVQSEPRWRCIPFLFLTAANTEEETLKGKELGVDDYLLKPMEPEALLATVRGKLRRLDALRQEWTELERVRRGIIAMLSHEFHAPLSTVKAAADLLLHYDVALDTDTLRALHKRIQSGEDRLEELVEDFLRKAQMETVSASSPSAPQNPSSDSVTILVVDDNDVALKEVEHTLLAAEDYNLLLAGSATQALEMMRQRTPDLIISDIMMPQMDGYAFYESVQSEPRWRSIPFIFLTVMSSEEDALRGKTLGVDDYLTKPFTPETLLASVRGKLRRSVALRQEWEELEQMRREIIAVLSHEFRTPLSTLKTAAELLLHSDATLSSSDLRELYEHIQRGENRMESLVEDFFLSARLAVGTARDDFEKNKRTMDLVPLLTSLANEWRPRIEEARMTFEVECPPTLPPVVAHEEHLRDAVGRLLSNAVKFNRPGGSVRLSASASETGVSLTIADTGMGIAETERERIFDKFVQLERRKFEQQGAGLGLAIAKGLVEVNGGRLTVESKVGEGSCFTIALPIQEEQRQ
jgi:DNA-binding response OmpR family regulator/two-component sensor histidine kinase